MSGFVLQVPADVLAPAKAAAAEEHAGNREHPRMPPARPEAPAPVRGRRRKPGSGQ